MRRLIAELGPLCLCLGMALGGCGGGGSGDGGGSPPLAEKAQQPLALTSDNAFDAVGIAFTVGTLSVGFAQVAVDVTEAHGSGRYIDIMCSAGGGVTATLTDRDGNGVPGPGDTLRVELNDCLVRPLGPYYLTGTMTIDYTTPVDAGVVRTGTITIANGFGWRAEGIDFRHGGALVFEQRADRLRRSVRARSATTPYTFGASDGHETLTETVTVIDCSHEARRDTARATTSMALRLASQLLEGAIEVSTPTPWQSWFGRYPDVGELLVRGAAGGSSRVASSQDGSELLQVTLNGAPLSSGSLSSQATGLLWSAAGWAGENGQSLGYQTMSGQPAFELVSQNTPGTMRPLGSVLEWAYSRPLSPQQTLTAEFRRQVGSPGPETIAANVAVEGALVTVTPTRQLEPGSNYWLQLRSDGGSTQLLADNGATLVVPDFAAPVAMTIQASAQSPGGDLLLGPGSELQLDASASTAPGGRIASVRWRQISGPAVTFANPESALTRVTSADPNSGDAVVEVAVANEFGEVDSARLTLRVVGTLTDVLVWRVSFDGGNANTVTSADEGATKTVRYQSGVLDVIVSTPSVFYRLLTTAGGTGSFNYPGPVSASWVASPTNTCAGSATGQLRIQEFELGTGGVLTRLALDLDEACPNGSKTRASVRFNSNVPYPD